MPDEQLTPHPKHAAADRFGATALWGAHAITEGLRAAGVDDDGAIVLRTGGPRASLDRLADLIDAALADDTPDQTDAPAQPG